MTSKTIDSTQDNKRIAKNTLMLYARMLFTMGVSLFTSREILQVLGIEDYGIYNVVGGIVTMFTFLNGGMIAATQRYLTFEIGRKDKVQLSKVFSTSIQIHALIALAVILLSETIGLWFLYEKMVIPSTRLYAAFWVFQCSVIACVVSIISVPYNAAIVAHEKMSAFAYISIIEVSLKLLVVYLLYISDWDKLIAYAILLLLVQLFIRYIYVHYCKKHFSESKYRHEINKPLLKEMSSFAGWGFCGSLAHILYTQGLNMMLNIFFGPVINAARGIAIQVQNAVQGFVGNFQMALNPQITKNYAMGNLCQMHSLMFRSARFSFFLLYFLTLPIFLEADYILALWLKTPPDNAAVFTRWILAISLIYTISNPCIIANQATGKIKVYQLTVGGILLLILPISYIILSLGAPAYSVFIVHFFIECIAQITRMYLLRKLINLPIRAYIKNLYLPILTVTITSCLIPLYVQSILPNGFVRLIVVGLISIISVGLIVFLIGLTKNERGFICKKIKTTINKFL